MENQPKYEKIEDYLNGRLSGSALIDFEEQIKSDKELAAQVLLFKEMDMALSDESALAFQKMVQEEGEAFFAENALDNTKEKAEREPIIRQLSPPRRRWMIAASFLVFILSTLLLWQYQSNNPTSNEDLFAQHYEIYSLNEDLRGNDSTATQFETGIQQYQAKDFDVTAQIFEALVAANERDMNLIFCLAHAYLNQNPPQFDLAQRQFQKIITNDSSIYTPKAKWYAALILIQKGEVIEAKSLLKDVTESGDKFGQKAKDLLKELK
ncbi:MAG: tetratricopeptide repeat protein [Chitinophagales bacterium]